MSDRPTANGARSGKVGPARPAISAALGLSLDGLSLDARGLPPTIVVGVDGSECSMRALSYAAGLARRQGAVLVAVYARRSPSGFAYLANTPGALAAVVEAESTTEARIRDEVAEECDAAGVEGTLVVRTGGTARALCATGRELAAHAVIVGSRPRLLARILPSGACRLAGRAGRPVVIVP